MIYCNSEIAMPLTRRLFSSRQSNIIYSRAYSQFDDPKGFSYNIHLAKCLQDRDQFLQIKARDNIVMVLVFRDAQKTIADCTAYLIDVAILSINSCG